MHWGLQTVGQCVCYKYELLAYTSVSARRFNEIKADTRQTSSLMQSSKFPRAPKPIAIPSWDWDGDGDGGIGTHLPALPGYIFLLPTTFRQMNELCACFCRVELTVSIKATLNPLAAPLWRGVSANWEVN